jgi:hypothetical protein
MFFSSCNPMGSKKLKVTFKNPESFKELKSHLNSVSIVDHQLIISGTDLSNITTATIKNETTQVDFEVESASETRLIANGKKAITLLAGGVFDLILSDAYGSATFQVTFSLNDGAVTASKLHSMGATAGQFLKYNGSTWVPSSLNEGQNYLGTWNATTNVPDLTNPSTTEGDYYIVSVAGTFNSITFSIGDWIISDGYNWQKVAFSKTAVSSFQGRKGIVSLVPADYVSLKDTGTSKITGSSLNDFADIDLTTLAPSNGSVLKFNGIKWVVGTDNTGVAGGSIVDSDISATADIAQSKINGLVTALSGKESAASLAADVRNVTLTGLSSSSGTIAAGDSLLAAFGKLMNSQSDYVSKSSGASVLTGTIAVSGTGLITLQTEPLGLGTPLAAANVTYVDNAISANGIWNKSGSTLIFKKASSF